MDFDAAIKAHSDWKFKLATYLKKPDGSLKAAEVCLDNKCPLGQWIYGEGAKFSTIPEYGVLKTEHAKFHKCAADVIKKADAGQSTTEEVALGSKSEFATTSSSVVSAIMKVKAKAK
jgi:hypothetical protein